TVTSGAPKAFASRQADPPDATYKLPEISVSNGCADDAWTATSTVNAPEPREFHTAVWTGSEMIVWGGIDFSSPPILGTGGRYYPGEDDWTATSIVNAHIARDGHRAFWTGSEMIIWGGSDGTNPLHTGARYNPNTDSWTPTGLTNVPLGRSDHAAVWTGD